MAWRPRADSPPFSTYAGKSAFFGTVRAGGRPGPVVGVVQPAALGIEQVRRLVHRQQAVPLGLGIAAVHRLGPVEFGVAAGNVVAVEVGDVTRGIGEDRVVGRVRLQLHGLLIGLVVGRLGACVGLRQRLDGLLHQADGDPFAVRRADDRAVVGAVDGEFLFGHAGRGLVRHDDLGRSHRALLFAVAVDEAVTLLDDGFEVFVDGIDAARGVHPAGLFVEALVDEELAPGDGAIGVQPLVAGHLQLGAEEEGGVGIDQQQRVVAGGVGGRDGDAVGAARLAIRGLDGSRPLTGPLP